MESVAAIIPMKENSQRVPNKNLRLMCGKPLFYWIIYELTHCVHVSDIYVDTDSKEIEKAVRAYFNNIKFINRPKALWGDDVSMNKILQYDLTVINKRHFIQAHSTSPLLRAETISRGIKTYFTNLNKNDSLFTISSIQLRCFTHEGIPINHNPDELIQTQYLKPVCAENSGFYIFSQESFAVNNRRIGNKPFLFEIDTYEAIDIDNENDFIAAEALCAVMKG